MNTATKLSAYGLSLAVVLGGGWAIGSAVGPVGEAPAPQGVEHHASGPQPSDTAQGDSTDRPVPQPHAVAEPLPPIGVPAEPPPPTGQDSTAPVVRYNTGISPATQSTATADVALQSASTVDDSGAVAGTPERATARPERAQRDASQRPHPMPHPNNRGHYGGHGHGR